MGIANLAFKKWSCEEPTLSGMQCRPILLQSSHSSPISLEYELPVTDFPLLNATALALVVTLAVSRAAI